MSVKLEGAEAEHYGSTILDSAEEVLAALNHAGLLLGQVMMSLRHPRGYKVIGVSEVVGVQFERVVTLYAFVHRAVLEQNLPVNASKSAGGG